MGDMTRSLAFDFRVVQYHKDVRSVPGIVEEYHEEWLACPPNPMAGNK